MYVFYKVIFNNNVFRVRKNNSSRKMMEVVVNKLDIRAAVPNLNTSRNVFPILRPGVADDFRVDDLQMIGFPHLDRLEMMKLWRRRAELRGETVETDVTRVVESDVLEHGPAIAVGGLDRDVVVEFEVLEGDPAIIAALDQDGVAALGGSEGGFQFRCR